MVWYDVNNYMKFRYSLLLRSGNDYLNYDHCINWPLMLQMTKCFLMSLSLVRTPCRSPISLSSHRERGGVAVPQVSGWMHPD